MASLVGYSTSSSGSEDEREEINYESSSHMLESLKEKFKMNSTPLVRNKVKFCNNNY